MRERRKAKDEGGVEELKEKYLYRMWDLSQFMKTLKQRFTQWFNARHDRRGTLWEERFKSVIVEDGYAARVMAAYIDLNPVRAGIVKRPEDYRWGGLAEAVAGTSAARAGIERVMSHFEEFGGGRREAKSWRKVIAGYREIIYTDGEERYTEDGKTGQVTVSRRGVSSEDAARVRSRGGRLSAVQMLRHRVRHFVDGAVLGQQAFVEEVFRARRERFGPRRTSGARKIDGCETLLRSLRDLRNGVG